MSARGLEEIRGEIDAVDGELAKLMRRRLEMMDEVAATKRELGLPVSDPARERDILSRVCGGAGPDAESALRLMFSTMFSIGKARQRAMIKGRGALAAEMRDAAVEAFPRKAVVACPGADGSYAQQAVSRLFPLPTILFFSDFEKVFEAVEKGLCPYGVLPIENSAVGSVAQVYDMMVRHRFHIARAVRVKVDHVLLGAAGARLDDIREVSSHPHALAQCGGFFKSHPGMRAVPYANTALAAKELAASGRRDAAVIASRACADLYGLDVLADGVADAAYNYTRFICISRNLEITPDANRISIMMSLPHRPGALNGVISKFASIDVNLTKLESRPIPGMDFEFRFTFDFDASPADPAVQALVCEFAQDPEVEHFTFLGAYAEL